MNSSLLFEKIQKVMEQSLFSVHTAIPAVVQSVSGGDCTAEALSKLPTERGLRKAPIFVNVPLLFPRGNSGGITWKVQKGDPVLLIISEVSLDEIMESDGDPIDGDDPRRFDLTDAIAVPGLFPSNKPAPETEGVLIYGEESKVEIFPDGKVEIGGDDATQIATKALADSYWIHTHTSAASGSPTSTPLTGGIPNIAPTDPDLYTENLRGD